MGIDIPEQARSYKHPILEYVFKEKRDEKIAPEKQEIITFTYDDIRRAMRELGIIRTEQASLSNLVIDLTRVDRGVESRVPKYVYKRGYDLINIKQYKSERIAGAFKFVGIGNAIQSWLKWPDSMPIIKINTSGIPRIVLQFIRQDEGALFSVIDYCDVLSKILTVHCSKKVMAIPIQHPLKWQPHEIDGFYISENPLILYPVEAKALSTKDQINLFQMKGELETMKMNYGKIPICPIGCQMLSDGMRFAIFPTIGSKDLVPMELVAENYIKVILEPQIDAWQTGLLKRKKAAQLENGDLNNFIG